MIVGVVAEKNGEERRVALVPETVARLSAKGIEIRIEAGAGESVYISDDDYRGAGGTIETASSTLLAAVDLLVKIHAPSDKEIEALREGATLICLLSAQSNPAIVGRLAARGITTIALENLPRTSAAQAMDVLSSQSTAAGYRAVIVAASALAKFFPMMMTPAGTIAPARVFVVGAGVAGLQAIATARRLGAVVDAFDVRAGVREEVESLGAKFIAAEIHETVETQEGYARTLSEPAERRARATIERTLLGADVCITTALVPGCRAPIVLTAAMVRRMRPGSVIVDLAAAQGGNCELTEPGKDIVKDGVTIIGRINLAGEVGLDASRMYSRNVEKLIGHFYHDGVPRFDLHDEISRRCVVTRGGEIVADGLRPQISKIGGAA